MLLPFADAALAAPATTPWGVPWEDLARGEAATGAACYAGGLVLLTLWESLAVPRLKLRGLLPDVPAVPGALSEADKAARWIEPLTAESFVPLPTLEELQSRGSHVVGRSPTVLQSIYVRSGERGERTVAGVEEVSEAWSAHYGGAQIGIRKTRRV